MPTVSYYKLSFFLIESACTGVNCSFVDLQVDTSKDGFVGFKNGKICVGEPVSWAETNSRIVSVYFENFKKICNCSLLMNPSETKKVLELWEEFLAFICYDNESLEESRPNESIKLRLFQFPIVWLLMKDIICPSYEVTIKNAPVIVVKDTPLCDVSNYVDKDEDSFIIVNSDVEYKPVRDAFVLLSVLEYHGFNPCDLIREIMLSDLKDKVTNAMKLAYNKDKEINDFLMTLLTFAGIENKVEQLVVDSVKRASSNKIVKQAQYNNLTNSFWYFGLLEKMLEPARGSDWSVYRNLLPWFKDIETKIEKEKRKAGRDGVNYEYMLRIKSGENTKEENEKIIEKRLGTDRVGP